MGQVLAGKEAQGLNKKKTDWTKNAVKKFCMRLRSSACVFLRLCASACVCAQKMKCPDVSGCKKFLHPDASFVQGLSRCTINIDASCILHFSSTGKVMLG